MVEASQTPQNSHSWWQCWHHLRASSIEVYHVTRAPQRRIEIGCISGLHFEFLPGPVGQLTNLQKIHPVSFGQCSGHTSFSLEGPKLFSVWTQWHSPLLPCHTQHNTEWSSTDVAQNHLEESSKFGSEVTLEYICKILLDRDWRDAAPFGAFSVCSFAQKYPPVEVGDWADEMYLLT